MKTLLWLLTAVLAVPSFAQDPGTRKAVADFLRTTFKLGG